ncbi:hypothetical protein NW759_004554 [Fusarium solani]|jgi:hypothetical protein|nr:hypothetical protein NW759_004554 [Fusarium solani]
MDDQFDSPAFEIAGIGPGPDTGTERSRQSKPTEASGLFNDPTPYLCITRSAGAGPTKTSAVTRQICCLIQDICCAVQSNTPASSDAMPLMWTFNGQPDLHALPL